MALSWVLAVGLASWGSTPATATELSPIGRTIQNFTLRDHRGAEHQLTDFADRKAIVVVFLGTECPLVKLYSSRLSDLHRDLETKGGVLLAINSNRHDSISEIEAFAKHNALPFPILKDAGSKVADQFGAQRTPHAFVLDELRTIRYAGRIDDQYGVGYHRNNVQRRDLAEAVEEVLAGKDVSVPMTQAAGCIIGRPRETQPTGDITYTKHVSRILQQRCAECHRAGQLAPFALTEYDEVIGWADTIVEVIEDQRMPPWHANPEFGTFANDCRIPDAEKQTLFTWIENGMPKGEDKDLPEPIAYEEGWRIPKPDVVISLPQEFTVPAEGEIDRKTGKPTGQVDYKYFQADYSFEEDTWVQAAEARPGNPAVVHHIIIFVKSPGGPGLHGELMSDWLVATAPGAMPFRAPQGMAKKIPKGSRLVFQMHYTPNGTSQVDRSSVGLVFADPKTVKKEIATDKAANQRFTIPPGADNHEVVARRTFKKDVQLLAMFPHMHLRGKSFRYLAEYPDGRPEEILLDIPHYDFAWQNSYIFAEPKTLPAGSTVRCIAHFDNSADNPSNPDPTQSVRWGDQTWEEMMIGYFDVVLADQDLTQAAPNRTSQFAKLATEREQAAIELEKLAPQAFESSQSFGEFAAQLQKVVPQLDRLCVTSFKDGEVTVEHAIHSPQVRREVAKKGFHANAAGFALLDYSQRTEPVANNRLSNATGMDLRMMSRLFAASFHVPVQLAGQPATINFWSTEADAFPPEAQKFLTTIGQQLVP